MKNYILSLLFILPISTIQANETSSFTTKISQKGSCGEPHLQAKNVYLDNKNLANSYFVTIKRTTTGLNTPSQVIDKNPSTFINAGASVLLGCSGYSSGIYRYKVEYEVVGEERRFLAQ